MHLTVAENMDVHDGLIGYLTVIRRKLRPGFRPLSGTPSSFRVQLNGNGHSLRRSLEDGGACSHVEDGKASPIGIVVIPNSKAVVYPPTLLERSVALVAFSERSVARGKQEGRTAAASLPVENIGTLSYLSCYKGELPPHHVLSYTHHVLSYTSPRPSILEHSAKPPRVLERVDIARAH